MRLSRKYFRRVGTRKEAPLPVCLNRQFPLMEPPQREAVCNTDDSTLGTVHAQKAIHRFLISVIKSRCCLVQEEPRGLFQKDTQECNALLLAKRKGLSPILFVSQPLHKRGESTSVEEIPQIVVTARHLPLRVDDRIPQRTKREIRFLRHKERGEVRRHRDLSVGIRPYARKRFEQRALAASGRPCDEEPFPRRDREVQIAQQYLPVRFLHGKRACLQYMLRMHAAAQMRSTQHLPRVVHMPAKVRKTMHYCLQLRKRRFGRGIIVQNEIGERVFHLLKGNSRLHKSAELHFAAEDLRTPTR